jgi:hypothetical protein
MTFARFYESTTFFGQRSSRQHVEGGSEEVSEYSLQPEGLVKPCSNDFLTRCRAEETMLVEGGRKDRETWRTDAQSTLSECGRHATGGSLAGVWQLQAASAPAPASASGAKLSLFVTFSNH